MLSEQNEKIRKVCCDIFEQLAFMFSEELSPEDIVSDEQSYIRASMSFSGYRSGSIDVTMPLSLAVQITRNILGLDEDKKLDQQHYEDSVKEMLNTICGRMLTSIFGEEAVFNLHVPSTEMLNDRQWHALIEKGDYMPLMIEDKPVLIHASL